MLYTIRHHHWSHNLNFNGILTQMHAISVVICATQGAAITWNYNSMANVRLYAKEEAIFMQV